MYKWPLLSRLLSGQNTRGYLLFFLLLFLPFRLACALPDEYFISAETVAGNLQDYLLIDAREPAKYLKGHIPGARSVQWQSLSDMDGEAGSETWGTLLNNQALEYQIQKLGLTSTDNIVVYADAHQGWGEDGRVVGQT